MGLMVLSRIRFQAKESGRALLKGNWLRAMGIVLIVFLLFMGLVELENGYRTVFGEPVLWSNNTPNTDTQSVVITIVFSVLTILFVLPLLTGQAEWYWNLTEKEKSGIGDVFGWFGSIRLYTKSVWISVRVFVRGLLWSLLIAGIPMALLAAGVYVEPIYGSSDTVQLLALLMIVTGCVLLLAAVLLLGLVFARYFLVYFLLVEDNTRKTGSVLREARVLSRGYRWEIFKFELSFLLWFASCFLFLGLPMLFVMPFFCSSATVLAKHVIFTQRARSKAPQPKETQPAGDAK